jgi:hypothetical protein
MIFFCTIVNPSPRVVKYNSGCEGKSQGVLPILLEIIIAVSILIKASKPILSPAIIPLTDFGAPSQGAPIYKQKLNT